MKRSLEKDTNDERKKETPYYEVQVTTERTKIVKKLNGVCNQLLKWGRSHHPANLGRCNFFRAAIYATSVQLQALKDKEIDDLTRRIEKLEKEMIK